MTAVEKAGETETGSNRMAGESSGETDSNPDDTNPRAWVERVQAWRESIRRRPSSNRIYRIVVGLVGAAIIVGGIVLLPLPGPGWVIIFIGLAVLRTEFEWAKRLDQYTRRQVRAWTDWLGDQALWVRALVGLATFLFVAAILWGVFAVLGVPGWVPESWVPPLPGLK
jgi:uncharacterized protein (TIGR02611 family)